jgi:hypothetical protein
VPPKYRVAPDAVITAATGPRNRQAKAETAAARPANTAIAAGLISNPQNPGRTLSINPIFIGSRTTKTTHAFSAAVTGKAMTVSHCSVEFSAGAKLIVH